MEARMKKSSNFLCIILSILLSFSFLLSAANEGEGEMATKKITIPGLTTPKQILVDSAEDRLYVSDGYSINIYSLKDFKLIKKFGESGEGPGKFESLLSRFVGLRFDVGQDEIMVHSRGKLSHFTKNGKFIKEINILSGRKFQLLGPKYLGLETFFKGKEEKQVLSIYNRELFKEKELISSPSWSERGIEDDEWRFLSTSVPAFGVLGNKIFFCGSSADFRVDVLDIKDGKSFTIERDYERPLFTKEHSAYYFDWIKKTFGQADYETCLRENRVPRYFPALRQVSIDKQESRVYLMTFKTEPGKSLKEGKMNRVEFFVYDHDGKFIKRVLLPLYIIKSLQTYPFLIDISPFSFSGGKLYQLVKQGDQLEYELHITTMGNNFADMQGKSAQYEWVRRAGFRYYDHSNSLTLDGAENIYITGTFEKITDFQGHQPVAAGREAKDIFMAKYDKDGRFLWVKTAGGEGFDEGLCITSDSKDNLIVTGFFQNAATFDNKLLKSAGDRDIFLAKYDSSGRLKWVNKAGGKANDKGYSVTCDPGGNIILTGIFRGTATFDGKKRTARGFSDIFIAKYDPQGKLLWLRQGGGKAFDRGFAVTTDTEGNIYATGYFKNSATFDSGPGKAPLPLSTHGDRDIYLVKYTPGGDAAWVATAGGTYWDYGYALACDNKDFVYVTGFFYENARFEEQRLTSVSQNDIFLAKYDSNGHLVWVRQAGGSSYARGKGLVADNKGNIYVTGHFKYDITFPGKSLTFTSRGDYDSFLAKYDDQGNFLWASQAGGKYYDESCAVALGKNKAIYITGEFRHFALFGKIEVAGFWEDIFLGKLLEK